MSNLNILIVEGNLKEENKNFSEAGIQTHTESLKDSLKHFTNNLTFDVVNPSSDENLDLVNEIDTEKDGSDGYIKVVPKKDAGVCGKECSLVFCFF